MKRIVRLQSVFAAAVIGVFGLAACRNTPALPVPQELKFDADARELSWNAVTFAAGYDVRVTGEKYFDARSTLHTYFDVSSLASGDYTFSVRAKGDKVSYADSEWSEEFSFSPSAESGMTYRLINGNTEYEIADVGLGAQNLTNGRLELQSEFRGKPVTGIGDSAFYNCTSVVEVVIPDTVKTIGNQAFQNCSYLRSVEIPESVESIGESAFKNCRSLQSVKIPNKVKTIEEETFSYCRALSSVDFGEGVESIGENAFLSCSQKDNASGKVTGLKAVSLPASTKVLGVSAFEDCDALETVAFSEVEEMGADCFRDCNALVSLNLGTALKEVSESAFLGCDLLTSLTVPDCVERIGNAAFSECTALSSVTLGKGLTSIGQYAFDGTLAYVTELNGTNDVVYLDGWAVGCKPLEDSGEYSNVTVQSGTRGIGEAAFYVSASSLGGSSTGNQNHINSVAMPDTVKYINDYAFYQCGSLVSVDMGDGVEILGNYAFAGCSVLNYVHTSKILKDVGAYAYSGCTRLRLTETSGEPKQDPKGETMVLIPGTVTHVGENAFYNTGMWADAGTESNETFHVAIVNGWIVGENSPSTSINVMLYFHNLNNLVGIADAAFYDKELLADVTLPESLRYIGKYAFFQCASLGTFVVPEGVEKIEDYTFYNCLGLKRMSLKGVKEIGRSAFYNCTSLYAGGQTDAEYFVLPSTLTSIGDFAFYGCAGLKSVDFGENLQSIGDHAFYRTSVSELNLPETCKEIGRYAFAKDAALTSVTAAGVERIGEYAFYDCVSLAEAHLPDSLQTIEKYAFRACAALKELNLGGVKEIGKGAFTGCASLTSVILPASLEKIEAQAFRGCTSLSAAYFLGSPAAETHIFYGCPDLTVYLSAAAQPEDWGRWNSTYRPEAWGAVFSAEGYVESIVTDGIKNFNAANEFSAPVREGYTFGGWATERGGDAVYDCDTLRDAPAGTTLYAVWLPAAN